MSLSRQEQETIINFNQEDPLAYIFTYDKPLQRHLEQKLKLVPTNKNSFGGKSYELPKKQIGLPRKSRIVKIAQKTLISIRKTRKRKTK